MSMPTSPTRLFVCDGCGAKLPVEPEHAGQKCRCGRCGKILVVPHDSVDDLQTDQEALPATAPKYIGFSCRVCDTRLSARPADVGRKAKCPDCGVLTVVPPPPKPRPKQIPRAMHGQQYGLWDVDTAPLPQEMTARQSKYFPVWCHVCDTLMHAEAKQVGKKLTCPDCGAKTVVLPPPKEKEQAPLLVPDGEEYQLDETEVLAPRPVPMPVAVLDSQGHEQYRETLRQEYKGRPKMPRFPTLTGVASLLVRGPVPTWWLALSCALSVAGVLGLAAWGPAGGGFGAIMNMCFLAMACIVGILWFAASSSIWCAILTDSSEGADRLYNPPDAAPYEWFGEALYVGVSLAASLIPGWAIGAIFDQPALGMGVGAFICFPVDLLSSFEQSSPLAILSPRILKSLIYRPGCWLLFYLETALILGAFIISLEQLSAYVLAIFPLGMAISLVYFRLLGRLAWWLAESLPLSDGDE